VAVDDPGLGAYLAVTSRTPVLGLPPERGAPNRLPSIAALSEPDLVRFLQDYSVEWVALAGALCAVDRQQALFSPVTILDGYRVYRVKAPTTPVREGRGAIAPTHLSSIRVKGATGDRIVLGFHYDPSLRCRPECTVLPFERDGRPPFLLVERPPPSFEITARPSPDR
jgi:hypothetical protein